MAIGAYVPSSTFIVKAAIALLIVSVVLKVLPIPDTYKAYFRV